MSDHTQAYFDYKTTTRVVTGVVIAFAMALATCAYSWKSQTDDAKVKHAAEAAYRQDMYNQGYIQVLKPCTPSGEMIWEKK